MRSCPSKSVIPASSQQHIDALVERHSRNGVFLDANLLLVLALGRYNPLSIAKHPHTSAFSNADFRFLEAFVGEFSAIVSTPNVLTEVGNLAGKLDRRFWADFRGAFGAMIKVIDERVCESKIVADNRYFAKLGLTDAAILELGAQKFLLLTADFPLSQIAQTIGFDVLNYNHLRPLVWELKF